MESHGDPWGAKHAGFTPKMMHPKLMQKGVPFMMPMMHKPGVFPKGTAKPAMMMHPNHKMMPLQPNMMAKYPEMGGHMPPMMGHPNPGYMHPGMNMPPLGMLPPMKGQDPMSKCSPRPVSSGNAGGSPLAMPPQRAAPRTMPTGQNAMMKASSPKSMMPGYMGGNIHPMMPSGGMGTTLSPRSVPIKHPSPGGMPTNVSPKQMMPRLSPDKFRPPGAMMGQQNCVKMPPHDPSRMIGPPKIGPGGAPMGMKMPPQLAPPGMAFNPMVGAPHAHMGMHGQRMGIPMTKPAVGKGVMPHMKPAAPLLLDQHAGPSPSTGPQRPHDLMAKGFRPPPKRASENPPPNLGLPLPAPPVPLLKVPRDNIMNAIVLKEEPQSTVQERLTQIVSSLVKDQVQRAEGLYGKTFTISDESKVVDALIEGFQPILNVLWAETKKAHDYSIDGAYLKFSGADAEGHSDFVVHRAIEELEEFYARKNEIESMLSSYRMPNRVNIRDFGFAGAPEEKKMTALMKAQEYADVGYNQRHLVQKITALDYRNALASEECIKLLPKSFRLQQIKMCTSLHFDIRTPPQSVSPPPELAHDRDGAETALSKCASSMETTNFSSVASKLLEKPGSSFMDRMPELPVLKLDMRYAKGLQVVPTPEMLMQLSNCNQPNSNGSMMFPTGAKFPMSKMLPLHPSGPPLPMVTQNPRPKSDGNGGALPPLPMLMKQPPSMHEGDLK
ncbi:hypothetical protein X943_001371 [Babesia divergens]|uniref:Uncharacterized protein n=1 Tax=Babesia divergens TaxID=32595 RepID=A0AAD9LI59_BABDI|nr:hypothetical protein X943_001371 [Babesia divergens]